MISSNGNVLHDFQHNVTETPDSDMKLAVRFFYMMINFPKRLIK